MTPTLARHNIGNGYGHFCIIDDVYIPSSGRGNRNKLRLTIPIQYDVTIYENSEKDSESDSENEKKDDHLNMDKYGAFIQRALVFSSCIFAAVIIAYELYVI